MNQINFNDLSVIDKLKLIEDIWESLLGQKNKVPSPSWHESVLGERSKNVAEGNEKILEWSKAKKMINQKINENKNS